METEAQAPDGAVDQGTVEEKTLPLHRVNEIVRREKAQAAEQARRELEAEYQQKMQQAAPQAAQAQSFGGVDQISAAQIEKSIVDKLMAEADRREKEYHLQAEQQRMEDLATKYFSKMQSGNDTIPEFKDVMANFNPSAFPQIVFLAADLDNTPQVMYELAKNPQKLAAIDYLAQRDPNAARNALSDMARSISSNDEAKANHVSAKPPLTELKASAKGGVDTGKLTLADYKKMYRV